MVSENQGVILTILIVILICIISLVGVIYSLVTTIRDLDLGTAYALEPDRKVSVFERNTNYNFAVPALEEVSEEEAPEKKEEKEVRTRPVYNYNFPIPDRQANPAMKSIQIPSIRFDSPIVVSDDGDSAVDSGAWHYPSNHPLDGEAIFLCHRRFFKVFDPKSCWDLDKVKEGDSLFINFADGTQAYYKVDSIAVTPGSDINIYHASDESVIKLISCAKEDGRIGSDSHRIVVLATRIS